MHAQAHLSVHSMDKHTRVCTCTVGTHAHSHMHTGYKQSSGKTDQPSDGCSELGREMGEERSREGRRGEGSPGGSVVGEAAFGDLR